MKRSISSSEQSDDQTPLIKRIDCGSSAITSDTITTPPSHDEDISIVAEYICPPKLIEHLQRLFRKTLIAKNSVISSESEGEQFGEELANKVVKHCLQLNLPSQSEFRKQINQIGESVAKVLAVESPVPSIQAINISDYYYRYVSHMNNAKKVFDCITQHHSNLAKDKSWEEALSSATTGLSSYASAASDMGQKHWVKFGNHWMLDYILSYFTTHRARSVYGKRLNQQNFQATGSCLTREALYEKIDSLTENLMSSESGQGTVDEKVKILDVGSCYNPFIQSSSAHKIDVTALDLFPMHPSVFKCDFLNLSVLRPIASSSSSSSSSSLSSSSSSSSSSSTIATTGSQVTVDEEGMLRALPAAHYDGVCMSLVLSYLPSPQDRLRMIQKTRELLVSPTEHRPHHSGLLLIIEKASIFPIKGKYPLPNSTTGNLCRADYINLWKESICKVGFELIKYEPLKAESRLMHAFVFATTPISNSSNTSSAVEGASESESGPQMWIKHDLARIHNYSHGIVAEEDDNSEADEDGDDDQE